MNRRSLPWEVYRRFDDREELMGATAYAEDAAAMVALLSDGSLVRFGTTVVWTQGEAYDGDAGESYDAAAEVMEARR